VKNVIATWQEIELQLKKKLKKTIILIAYHNFKTQNVTHSR